MRRKFSYNLSTIFQGFLLLISITFTLFLIKQALIYMKGNINGVLVSTLVFTILAILFILIFKIVIKFMKGDFGEMDVENILYKLPKEFSYISDIVIGEKGNIDGVIVGPTGIWTVESKYQTEKIIIHDKFLDEKINQAFAESRSVQDFLRQNNIFTPVTPILIFANKKSILHFGEHSIRDVYVIGIAWLKKLLTDRKSGNLTQEQCNRIYQILKLKSSIIN